MQSFFMRAVCVVVFAACGGNATPTETPQAGSASASASAAPSATSPTIATKTWKDMDHAERLAFMKGTVMPKMHDEFAAADAKKWGDANCTTCHGDGAKDGTFKMPNPKLPKLPSTPEGFQKMAQDKTKAAALQFMKDKVVPDMATMLGEKPFDMQTHTGFGCGECHMMDK